MPPQFVARELLPEDRAGWERFVDASSTGSPYAMPEYLDALSEATGARYRILICERDREILGGIPLFERSNWAGEYSAPRLLLYYNGFVLADASTRYPSQHTSQQLRVLESLVSAIEKRGYASLRIHSRETLRDVRALTERGWQARPSYSYLMPLNDMKESWNRVEGNFRRLIRRCEKEGVQLSRDTDFSSFFALHREIHLRKGVPLYLPELAFETFYRRLEASGLARLYHARDREGRALASQLVLTSAHPVTHTVCAGAAADAMRSGASVFLRWKVCEALAQEGYAANDLTDAELNPVTRFKSQLGGQLADSFILDGPQSMAWGVHSRWERTRAFPQRVMMAVRRRVSSPES